MYFDKVIISQTSTFSRPLHGILEDTIDLAAKHDCLVEFTFNGVTVTVSQFSDIGKVCEDTLVKMEINKVLSDMRSGK